MGVARKNEPGQYPEHIPEGGNQSAVKSSISPIKTNLENANDQTQLNKGFENV